MALDVTVDGGGHIPFSTNTLLLCGAMRKRLSFVLVLLARPKILDGPKHDFLPRNGTNDHEQPRSVRLPVPQGRTGLTRPFNNLHSSVMIFAIRAYSYLRY